MFSRAFGDRGRFPLKQYLRPYKVGDYVDIITNGAVHKGMPFKYYHGRTGIVFNVAKRSIGVEVNKEVRNRVEKKRINLRVEHIQPSKCRQDFLDRVKLHDDVKRAAKKAGVPAPINLIKRVYERKAGFVVKPTDDAPPSILRAVPFDDML
jgi:large subunit ribosomal protein L21e